MKKIPTLFVRDETDRRYVTEAVTPGCEWVFAGEGVATRKWDGTCVMLDDDGRWWARREVKAGNAEPANFVAVDHDSTTGKTVGWEPIAQSPFAKFHAEVRTTYAAPGTYELIGPKINGNPEHLGIHVLVRHGREGFTLYRGDLNFADIRVAVLAHPAEGIVWHHPDGRMAKIKRRDMRS